MNNKISLDALRVLDAIEAGGSFHAGAKSLHKVRSAVSHAVRKLESDLGVQLYDRSGRRAVLTPTGREVLHAGRRILRAVSELQERARYIDGGWESEFTIALDSSLPLRLLVPALKEFGRMAPQVKVNIIRATQEGTWGALTGRCAQLAIGTGTAGPPAGESRVHRLGELAMLYVVAPRHPLAVNRDELTQELLHSHRYIATTDGVRSDPLGTRQIRGLSVGLSLADLRDTLEALRAGLGFGLLAEPLARVEIAARRLVELHGMQAAAPLTVQYAHLRRTQGKALEWFVGAMHDSGQAWLAKAFE